MFSTTAVPKFAGPISGFAESIPDPPAELLVRAKTGDQTAFEQLIRLFDRQLIRLSCRMLGQLSDAEDVAQESLVRFHANLRRFDSVDEIAPWLYRVAIHLCRDQIKRRSRWSNELPEATVPSRTEGDLEVDQRRALLMRALQRLPERERAAILLRDLEGLTAEAAGEILGVSAATVRVQVASARAKLKLWLEQKL
jgi:RNA polymerase sigma-70 factor, ECF subfamily